VKTDTPRVSSRIDSMMNFIGSEFSSQFRFDEEIRAQGMSVKVLRDDLEDIYPAFFSLALCQEKNIE
jgi:hypothetical protein